jgi:hypothetical protein
MTSAIKRTRNIRNRVKDYLLCSVIVLAFLGTGLGVEIWLGRDAFIRWGGLAGFTAGLFGYFVNESRQYLRDRPFWQLTAVLLVVHLAAFVILLTHVGEWKLMWFIVMVVEYPVFINLRSRLPYHEAD